MTLEQLSYTLARINPTHDFILMHLMETRFEGFEQHFYDFGLFFREFVLLVPHDGRTEPRTEDIANASFSKRRVLAAQLGQECIIIELEPLTSQLGDIRQRDERMPCGQVTMDPLPGCGRNQDDRGVVAALHQR